MGKNRGTSFPGFLLLIAFAKRDSCKIHLRLVAQAFQPVQMQLKVIINNLSFSICSL